MKHHMHHSDQRVSKAHIIETSIAYLFNYLIVLVDVERALYNGRANFKENFRKFSTHNIKIEVPIKSFLSSHN